MVWPGFVNYQTAACPAVTALHIHCCGSAKEIDLRPGQEPHNLDLPLSEVTLRYRAEISTSDEAIASLYSEAAWLEGARSTLLISFRGAANVVGRSPLITVH